MLIKTENMEHAVLKENILDHLGNPGKYQIYLTGILTLVYIYIACNNFAMSIYGWTPTHHCKLKYDDIINNSCKLTSKCSNKKNNDNSCNAIEFLNDNLTKLIKCRELEGWTYNTLPNEQTIVTEWDLVCEHKIWVSISSSIYFMGILVGGIFLGDAVDRFGRKIIIIGALLVSLPFSVGLSFVNSFWQFLTIRFILGFLLSGLQISSTVMLYETISSDWKFIFIPILYSGWGIGLALLGVFAYFMPNWRIIQIILSGINGIALILTSCIFESPRWLFSKGYFQLAINTLQRIAKINNLKDSIFANITMEEKNSSKSFYNILVLFKTPKMRIYTILHLIIWLSASMTYYGLSLDITNQLGHKYLDSIIGGSMEALYYLSFAVFLKRCPRKILLSLNCILTSLCCLTIGVLPYFKRDGNISKWPISFLYYFATLFAAGSYASEIFYTSETFPTVTRGLAIGLTYACSRLGLITTSFVLYLQYNTYQQLPVLLFGGFILISSFSILGLPETVGKPLPDTIEDVEKESNLSQLNVKSTMDFDNKVVYGTID